MSRCLIVHVGPAKSGTTSIQLLLATRARALAASGIRVLAGRSGGGYRGTHNFLAHELADPCSAGPTPGWARLADEIRHSDAKRFVLSAEAFATPARRWQCAARVAELADRERLDVAVVGYVRPQWELVESAYAQGVKAALTTLPFDRFAAAMCGAAERGRLDYNTVFAPFRAAFGAGVRVFPAERARRQGGLTAHFLTLLGADAALARGLPRVNVRVGAAQLEVRRRIAERLAGRPDDRAWLGERGPRPLLWLSALLADDAPFAGFDAHEIRAVEVAFAAANARFARDFGIDAGGVLFEAPATSRPRRSNVARWQDIDTEKRALVRRYVLDQLGVDLDPGTGRPCGRWPIRWRIAADLAGRGAASRVRWRVLLANPALYTRARWRRALADAPGSVIGAVLRGLGNGLAAASAETAVAAAERAPGTADYGDKCGLSFAPLSGIEGFLFRSSLAGNRRRAATFCGREDVVARVMGLAATLPADGGDDNLVLIEGGSGAGKSTLLVELSRRLEAAGIANRVLLKPPGPGQTTSTVAHLASILAGVKAERVPSLQSVAELRARAGARWRPKRAAVLIDEIQRLPRTGAARDLVKELRSLPGLPVLIVCAGAPASSAVLARAGLHGLGNVVRLGSMSPAETLDGARAWLAAAQARGLAASDRDAERWAVAIAGASKGWPGHLTCYLTATAEALLEQDAPALARADLGTMLRRGRSLCAEFPRGGRLRPLRVIRRRLNR